MPVEPRPCNRSSMIGGAESLNDAIQSFLNEEKCDEKSENLYAMMLVEYLLQQGLQHPVRILGYNGFKDIHKAYLKIFKRKIGNHAQQENHSRSQCQHKVKGNGCGPDIKRPFH